MIKILFVCQGNICRSPAAEAVFNGLIRMADLAHRFEVDSAGTISYHAGEPADARMQKHANKRGYRLTSISRKVRIPDDFKRFDMLIAMDDENFNDLLRMAPSQEAKQKVCKMTPFAKNKQHSNVPDPYYGGDAGFELVLDILEDACKGLLESLVNKK
jgi:protein-tyrosine phosphatase